MGIRVSQAMILFAEIGGHALAGQEPVYKFSTTVFGTTVVIAAGLKGLVYELEPATTMLPDFESMRPVATIHTTALNVPPQDFMQGFPGISNRFEWFAIDYTGNFWIARSGKYKFALNSDDGSKLYIDGTLVIDNDGQHPPISRKGSISLTVGVHRIRVSYFQGAPFHGCFDSARHRTFSEMASLQYRRTQAAVRHRRLDIAGELRTACAALTFINFYRSKIQDRDAGQ